MSPVRPQARDRFEAEPDTGMIGKGCTRLFHLLWQYGCVPIFSSVCVSRVCSFPPLICGTILLRPLNGPHQFPTRCILLPGMLIFGVGQPVVSVAVILLATLLACSWVLWAPLLALLEWGVKVTTWTSNSQHVRSRPPTSRSEITPTLKVLFVDWDCPRVDEMEGAQVCPPINA